jgi:biotin synthase
MRMRRREIIDTLHARGAAQDDLFAEARAKRAATLGDFAVLRGVVELTNLCRVDCDYCPMRRSNTRENSIFTLGPDDLMERVRLIKETGIDVVFLQAGEVPQTTRLVGEAIPRIRELFEDDVEILLNLGNKKRSEYEYLREQGATSYILKHETSDPALHQAIRHESLQGRLRCLQDLLDLGYKVGTGAIVGLPGQSMESLAEDILLAHSLGVHMVSVAPFIPASGTPFADHPSGDVNTALNAIAAMRLLGPHWLIPSVSAFERVSSGGQHKGFQAGANVMTINFSDDSHVDQYLIYGKDRFVVRREHADRALVQAGLTVTGSIFRPGRRGPAAERGPVGTA